MEPRSDARTPSHVKHPKRCYWLEWLVAVCFGPPEGETPPLRPASHPTLLEEESWLLVSSFACFRVFAVAFHVSRGTRCSQREHLLSCCCHGESIEPSPAGGLRTQWGSAAFWGREGVWGVPPRARWFPVRVPLGVAWRTENVARPKSMSRDPCVLSKNSALLKVFQCDAPVVHVARQR